MPDTMTFPETVDEFMEEYKIVDTEEVYTNGAELVPIFRMKQWFEHIDAVKVVRCKDCEFSCMPNWASCEVYCAKHDNWFKVNGYCHLGRGQDA